MLCPANHATVLGEQLLAGGTDRLIKNLFKLKQKKEIYIMNISMIVSGIRLSRIASS